MYNINKIAGGVSPYNPDEWWFFALDMTGVIWASFSGSQLSQFSANEVAFVQIEVGPVPKELNSTMTRALYAVDLNGALWYNFVVSPIWMQVPTTIQEIQFAQVSGYFSFY